MGCPRTALSAEEIRKRLAGIPGWQAKGDALERVYEGNSYLEALECLNAVARLSEAEDHHPDMRLDWKTLTVRYWTHTAGGVTERDFDLAQKVEVFLEKP